MKFNASSVAMAHSSLSQATWRLVNLGVTQASCALARAYFVTADDHTPVWSKARVREGEWQIRRFHDVVEAIQQKKKWPPLEATT